MLAPPTHRCPMLAVLSFIQQDRIFKVLGIWTACAHMLCRSLSVWSEWFYSMSELAEHGRA